MGHRQQAWVSWSAGDLMANMGDPAVILLQLAVVILGTIMEI